MVEKPINKTADYKFYRYIIVDERVEIERELQEMRETKCAK